MAQIIGLKMKKAQKSFITHDSSTCEVSDKFVTGDGTEFVLHEFDSGNSSNSGGFTSRESYKKKRGRPRKDEGNSFESDGNCTSFDVSPRSKARQERKERKERKREKLSSRRSHDDETPKKRGRPRKFNLENSFKTETEQNISISDYVLDFNEFCEKECSSRSFSESSSGFESRNSLAEAGGIPEILKYQEVKQQINEIEVHTNGPNQTETEVHWTPIQRLTQLNQSLAFINMYKDLLFWDRITAEFIDPSVQFRLEVGSERAFDIPFIVISKFFWVSAQTGLHRLQVAFNGINEFMGPERHENGAVLFNSSDSFIYSQFYGEKLMLVRKAFQFIEFDSCGKITKWNIRVHKTDKYYKTVPGKDEEIEEFVNELPKRSIEFLDVALVMNTVLPDPSSWLTWFYTYIQQHGLQNFSIVALSRAPSPYRFIAECESTEDKANLEFIERGQDYIFTVLEGGRQKEFEGVLAEHIEYQDNEQSEFELTEVNVEELLQDIQTTVNLNTIDHDTVSQSTIDHDTVNQSTIDHDSVNQNTIDSYTVNQNTIDSYTVNLSTVNSTTEYNTEGLLESSNEAYQEVYASVIEPHALEEEDDDDFFDNYG